MSVNHKTLHELGCECGECSNLYGCWLRKKYGDAAKERDDLSSKIAAYEKDEDDYIKTPTVCLCGSSFFTDIMAVCAWLIERDEGKITTGLHYLPAWYCNVPDHLAEHEGVADKMDTLHLRKIDACEGVFIVNVDDYIGDSMRREIKYAVGHEKKIRWFTHDKIGRLVIEFIGNSGNLCISCHKNIAIWPAVCDACQDKECQAELEAEGAERCRSCGMFYDGGDCCTYCGDMNPTDDPEMEEPEL